MNTNRIIVLIVALFLALSQIGFAQVNFDKTKLDNYFNALEQHNKFMGSIAISKNGEIIYTKSIGYADFENKVKATAKSKYRIGSISKSFTATLIIKAVEEEKIDLNQTIDKWFPMIKNANIITVEHLLRHRSGIHNFTADAEYITWNTQPKTEQDMIGIILKGGSDFKPDSRAEYSNSNYVLLSYILEKTFNKSYSTILQDYIINPIGLANTYVFGKINPNDNECKSYTYLGSWELETETDFTIPLGAGAIISTPSDLTKFADALFGGKLLKKESLETMKTLNEGYGIGLFQFPFLKKIGYGHTGGIDGFSSVYCHFAEENISYALTSNGANYNNNDISIAVLSAVFDNPYEIPEFTTFTLNAEDFDKYSGIYSSKQIPLKITITKVGNTLIAQGTGQPKFELQATSKDKFRIEQVGANFEFIPSEKKMILKQGGGQFIFIKE